MESGASGIRTNTHMDLGVCKARTLAAKQWYLASACGSVCVQSPGPLSGVVMGLRHTSVSTCLLKRCRQKIDHFFLLRGQHRMSCVEGTLVFMFVTVSSKDASVN